MSHEANLNRLSDIAARGWDQPVALIDGRTATMRDDPGTWYCVSSMGNRRVYRNQTGQELRRLVGEAAHFLVAQQVSRSPTLAHVKLPTINRQVTYVRSKRTTS